MTIRVIIEISDKNIEAVRQYHMDYSGKYPSQRWLREFLKADVQGIVNETFLDGLDEAVEAYI